jgi:hypothetical protein
MSMSHDAGRGVPTPVPRLAPSGTRLSASRDQAGHHVHGLLGRAALRVQGQAAGLVGQPGVQPGGPGHVAGLLTRLRHAPASHLLDAGRVEARPVQQAGLRRTQDLGRVQPGQHPAPLADRGARRSYDHRVAHGVPPGRLITSRTCSQTGARGCSRVQPCMIESN